MRAVASIVPRGRSRRSPKLAAFVARNGPLDHFVRLRRAAPHPSARAL